MYVSVRILKGWLLSLQGGGGEGHDAVDGLCCCLIDRDRRKEKGRKGVTQTGTMVKSVARPAQCGKPLCGLCFLQNYNIPVVG